jgi:hypothetical protein
VRIWHSIGELWRKRPAYTSSLIPLFAFSLLVASLLAQNSVSLAYPSFQSPVQSPAPPPAPTETPPAPPEESPVAPPSETPGEQPTPGETPGEQPSPAVTPEASPSAGVPVEAATPDVPAGEESVSPVRGLSWAVLIDTCVIGLSSVWLCCGGLALVVFGLLVIATFVLRVT